MNTSHYPRRPNVDAIISACMYITRECLRINITGKSFEAVEDETRRKLYEALDKNLGGPPLSTAPKQPDYETEYYKLQRHHAELKASYDAVVVKVRKLQQMVTPAAQQPFDPSAPFGPDWNGIVYAINNLFPVKP